MNITLPEVNRSISQKQMMANQKKWGSPNWIYFTQIVNTNEIFLENNTFILSLNGGTGDLEVDNNLILVESRIYLKIDYNLEEIQMVKGSKENAVLFDIFLTEILTNYESETISEIRLISKRAIYNTKIFCVLFFYFIINKEIIGWLKNLYIFLKL